MGCSGLMPWFINKQLILGVSDTCRSLVIDMSVTHEYDLCLNFYIDVAGKVEDNQPLQVITCISLHVYINVHVHVHVCISL